MKKIVIVSILALSALVLNGCGTTTGERAGSAALMGACLLYTSPSPRD